MIGVLVTGPLSPQASEHHQILQFEYDWKKLMELDYPALPAAPAFARGSGGLRIYW